MARSRVGQNAAEPARGAAFWRMPLRAKVSASQATRLSGKDDTYVPVLPLPVLARRRPLPGGAGDYSPHPQAQAEAPVFPRAAVPQAKAAYQRPKAPAQALPPIGPADVIVPVPDPRSGSAAADGG